MAAMDSHITTAPGDTPRPVVALVAHDGRKQEMAEWAAYNRGTLERCTLFATRTTGRTLVTTLGVLGALAPIRAAGGRRAARLAHRRRPN